MFALTAGILAICSTTVIPETTRPTTKFVASKAGCAAVVMTNPEPFGTPPCCSCTVTSLPLYATRRSFVGLHMATSPSDHLRRSFCPTRSTRQQPCRSVTLIYCCSHDCAPPQPSVQQHSNKNSPGYCLPVERQSVLLRVKWRLSHRSQGTVCRQQGMQLKSLPTQGAQVHQVMPLHIPTDAYTRAEETEASALEGLPCPGVLDDQ